MTDAEIAREDKHKFIREAKPVEKQMYHHKGAFYKVIHPFSDYYQLLILYPSFRKSAKNWKRSKQCGQELYLREMKRYSYLNE